jgi:Bacterial Ig domain
MCVPGDRAALLRRFVLLFALVVAAVGLASGQAFAASVSITSPSAGATVKGTVAITAQATANGGDTMSSITFYDGVNFIGSISCQGQQSCTATINWRATGLTGAHTLTARTDTRNNDRTTSAGVTVTVETPPPSVAITSPGPSAVVKGTVPISVETATDSALDDYPESVTLYDGVNFIASFNCQGQITCSGTVNWGATGLTGVHTLKARVTTDRSVQQFSADVPVTVVTPPPTVQITSPKNNAGFRRPSMRISVSTATDPALADYPESVAVYDGTTHIGSFNCQGQITCSGSVTWTTTGLKGRHNLTAVVRTDKDATARSARVRVGQRVRTRAKATCTLSATRARVGRRVRGTCTAPGVPKGTGVAIRYRTAGGSYATAVRTKVGTGGGFRFTLRGNRRATYRLVVTINSNSRYLKTTKSIGTLRIT